MNRTDSMPGSRTQRGAAALVVILALLLVMTLLAAYADRNLVFELRAAQNQYRAARAFEAAEAGADWAVAMLNDPRPIDARCAAAASPTLSFRERLLEADAVTQALRPREWSDGGTLRPLRARCTQHAGGLSCDCAVPGSAPAPGTANDAPGSDASSFEIQFSAASAPRAIELHSSACVTEGCEPGAAAPFDAHVHETLGLLPGLASAPVASLTVKGNVTTDGSAFIVSNTDAASGGITVHAGERIVLPGATLRTAPGGSPTLSTIDDDQILASVDADRFFVSFFGVPKTLWRKHPGLAPLHCPSDCTATLMQTLSGAGPRMVWVDGDLRLSGPASFGTDSAPVIVVASGTLQVTGPVMVRGLIYAHGIVVEGHAASPALVQGAAVSEGDFAASGPVSVVYDATLLANLKATTGTFTRLPGSWKDF